MAEVAGITAGIISILRAIKTTGEYLDGIKSASREARDVASQVQTTKAILKSIKASLRTVHHSQEFNSIWHSSTKLVLDNIEITISQLNKQLGVNGKAPSARLGFWFKAKWPLQRAEGIRLQDNLRGYLTMLGMVQNAFLVGTLQTVQNAAKDIDDILSQDGSYPLSSAGGTGSVQSSVSEATLRPEDSISFIQEGQVSPGPRTTPIAVRNLPSPAPQQPPGNPDYRSNASAFTFVIRDLLVAKNWDMMKNRTTQGYDDESLGPGHVTVAASYDRGQLWLRFVPKGLEMHESLWILEPASVVFKNNYDAPYYLFRFNRATAIIGSGQARRESLLMFTETRGNQDSSIYDIRDVVIEELIRRQREQAIISRAYNANSAQRIHYA